MNRKEIHDKLSEIRLKIWMCIDTQWRIRRYHMRAPELDRNELLSFLQDIEMEMKDLINNIDIPQNEAEIRMFVLKRDDFTCHFCNYKPSRIVHHINSRNYYEDYKFDPRNLITVCDACHKKYHEGNLNGIKQET